MHFVSDVDQLRDDGLAVPNEQFDVAETDKVSEADRMCC